MPFRAKLKQAIPACPAVLFYPVTDLFCAIMHILYTLCFRILAGNSHSVHAFRISRYCSVVVIANYFFLCQYHAPVSPDANILSLSDIFRVLPAYIQAWKGTDRIRYPVSLFRNAGLRLSPSGSDPPHIPRHSLLQGCG